MRRGQSRHAGTRTPPRGCPGVARAGSRPVGSRAELGLGQGSGRPRGRDGSWLGRCSRWWEKPAGEDATGARVTRRSQEPGSRGGRKSRRSRARRRPGPSGADDGGAGAADEEKDAEDCGLARRASRRCSRRCSGAGAEAGGRAGAADGRAWRPGGGRRAQLASTAGWSGKAARGRQAGQPGCERTRQGRSQQGESRGSRQARGWWWRCERDPESVGLDQTTRSRLGEPGAREGAGLGQRGAARRRGSDPALGEPAGGARPGRGAGVRVPRGTRRARPKPAVGPETVADARGRRSGAWGGLSAGRSQCMRRAAVTREPAAGGGAATAGCWGIAPLVESSSGQGSTGGSIAGHRRSSRRQHALAWDGGARASEERLRPVAGTEVREPCRGGAWRRGCQQRICMPMWCE